MLMDKDNCNQMLLKSKIFGQPDIFPNDTILAYQLINTIRYMLRQKGLHYDWGNILRIVATKTMQTLELPTDKKTIYL